MSLAIYQGRTSRSKSNCSVPSKKSCAAWQSRSAKCWRRKAKAGASRRPTPDELWREDQQPVMIVTAELNEEEAGLGSVVQNILQWMADVQLPANYRWELGGHYLRQQEAFTSLLFVMVVAILLVFITLAF